MWMVLICRDKLGAGQTALAAAQRHEENLLQDALKNRRAAYGLPANLDSAPVKQPFSFRQPLHDTDASSSQSSAASPLGFQPSTSVDMAQAAAIYTPAGNSTPQRIQDKQRPQQRQQAQNPPGADGRSGSLQRQGTAPAGFVQFGVKPKGHASQ